MKIFSRLSVITLGVFFLGAAHIPKGFSATTLLRISSTPSGAKIIVNDLDQKKLTPASLNNLEAGKKYKIRLEKKGYKTYETSIKVEAGSNLVHGDLEHEKVEKEEKASKKEAKKEPEKKKETKAQGDDESGSKVERAFGYNKNYKEGTYGWLEVSSIPNRAIVYINDERQVGPTPNKYKTPVGTVKVQVVIRGKAAREFTGVKIKPGSTTVLETVDFRDEITRPSTRDLLK